MNYGFININNCVVEQKSIIKKIAQKRGYTIDAWLEFDIVKLRAYCNDFLKENDVLFISNLKLFKSQSRLDTMNVLKTCNVKDIMVYSEENNDKSPMYLICLLNKMI